MTTRRSLVTKEYSRKMMTRRKTRRRIKPKRKKLSGQMLQQILVQYLCLSRRRI